MSSPGFVLTRRLAIIGLVVLGLGAVLATVAGEMLTRPARATAPVVPTGLQAHAVTIPVPGGTVAGWLAAGEPGKGAVLLLHGVRSSRLQMVGRAQFLHAAGYTALLIDLPSHGESTGTRITFGATESSAIRATLKYLQQSAPGEKVAVVGVSLGAASLVLGGAVPVPAAVVVESMYPSRLASVSSTSGSSPQRGTWPNTSAIAMRPTPSTRRERPTCHNRCTADGGDDPERTVGEVRHARRLRYRSKAAVRPEHAPAAQCGVTPGADERECAPAMLRCRALLGSHPRSCKRLRSSRTSIGDKSTLSPPCCGSPPRRGTPSARR